MSKTKMEWTIFKGFKDDEAIYVMNLTREEYEDKYRGNLYCINGCDAKVKFTERKNGIKYLSTWNNEGEKHNDDCEYHVKYKGSSGRKRLEADNRSAKISEEQIINAIDRKFKELTTNYLSVKKGREFQGTNKVEDLGEETVKVYSDDGKSEGTTGRKNVTSIKAEYINSTLIGIQKCVIGNVKSATVNYDKGEIYGYLNLKNDNYNVSVYFPEAFFKDDKFSENNYKKLVEIINNKLENDEKVIVVCYGEIKNKKKSKRDFNINIISPNRIKINGCSLNEILIKGKIKIIK